MNREQDFFENEHETYLHEHDEDDDDEIDVENVDDEDSYSDEDDDESRGNSGGNHNEMERGRRNYITTLFGKLKEALDGKKAEPDLKEKDGNKSKDKTLEDTIEFMETYSRKMKRLQELRKQVDAVVGSGNAENSAQHLGDKRDTQSNAEEGAEASAGPSGSKRPRLSGKNASKEQLKVPAKRQRKGK